MTPRTIDAMGLPQETDDHDGARGTALSEVELAWEVLKELGASERHFNNLETEYRKLASLWLLASFAGIGFMLKESLDMAVPRECAVMGIGFAGSIGIFVLWIVDLLVYHQLLDACFEEAKKIEEKYPQLSRSRTGMEKTQGGGKVVTTRLRWFYILLSAAPVVFSAPLFVLWCQKRSGWLTAVVVIAVISIYLTVLIAAIWRISPGLKKTFFRRARSTGRPG